MALYLQINTHLGGTNTQILQRNQLLGSACRPDVTRMADVALAALLRTTYLHRCTTSYGTITLDGTIVQFFGGKIDRINARYLGISGMTDETITTVMGTVIGPQCSAVDGSLVLSSAHRRRR